MMRRRELMMLGGGLPGAYRRVEYLESDGNAYINLNVTATIDCEIGLDCYVVRSSSGNVFYMGCRRAGCAAIIGTQPKFVYQFGDMNASLYCESIQANARHKIIANNVGGFVDGIKIYVYSGSNNAEESRNHMKLFATADGNNNVEFKAPAGFRVYGAYVKKGGEYTLSLIPCVRKSNNKPGMYDTVSKTFFTNAGSGEFIVPEQ